MPICPECEKKIECLDYQVKGIQEYEVFMSPTEKMLEFDRQEFSASGMGEYYCPECGEVLFYSYKTAYEFLGRA